MRAGTRLGSLIALVVACGCAPPLDGSDDALTTALAAALRETRATEGRLTHGGAHAPCDVTPPASRLLASVRCSAPPRPGTRAFDRVSALAGEVRVRLGTNPTAQLARAAAWAQVALAPDDTVAISQAEALLEDRRAAGAADAGLLSDLAALHLARAQARDDALALLYALERADEALEQAPEHAAALFNRAVILERLELWSLVAPAWRRFLAVEASGGWSAEARSRLAVAEAVVVPAEARWVEEAERATAAGDTEALETLVVRSPQRAREHALWTLLPAWADAFRESDAERAALSLLGARALGEALVPHGLDATVADAVGALDLLVAGADTASLRAAATVLGDLAEARYHREQLYDYAKAEELARQASRSVHLLGPGMESELRVLLGAIENHTGRIAAADARFLEVLAAPTAGRYQATVGRAHWGRGLDAVRNAAYQSATQELQKAIETYHATGESGNLGAMYGLLANNLFYGSRNAESLRSSLPALRILTREGSSPWLTNTQLGIGFIAERLGLYRCADDAVTAALETADSVGRVVPRIDALVIRAGVRTRLGSREGATGDLRRARALLDQVTTARDYLEAQIREAELKVDLRRSKPGVAGMEDLLRNVREQGRTLLLPETLLGLASAYVQAGDTTGARNALDRAMGELGATRRDLSGAPDFEASFVQLGEAIIDMAAELALAQGDGAEALRMIGRSRILEGTPRGPLPTRRLLREGEAVVEYAVFPFQLVAWVLRRDTLAVVRVPVDSASLGRAVRGWLDGTDPAREGSSAEALSEWLLGSLQPHLSAVRRLTLVPDRVLGRVPFAALQEPGTGRYLVEDVEVSYARSSSVTETGPPRTARAAAREGGALVVGTSDFDRAWFTDLPALPGAAREAEAVASLFPAATSLTGATATPTSVLEGLPRASTFHFAGHALASSESVGRSRLLLAPGPDGQSVVNAGTLRNLDLRGLELVVLSACSTAGMRTTRGGGLLGLASAFLDAGARGVVATLDAVDDRVATELMVRFHQLHLEGAPPASALRSVQLEALMAARAGKPAPSPKTWGSFVYIRD